MYKGDGRNLQIHRADADLETPESLQFPSSLVIEVENLDRPVGFEVPLEFGVGIDL
ncbi:MAG TPA: hypothetical protein VFF52_17340 [Isosphaeraceae bacterium]|nr:hypothetical protein [Isosphaeraceae bacterium]